MQRELVTVLKQAAERLAAVDIDTARLDAELLLAHVLGVDRLGLLSYAKVLTEKEKASFDALIERRLAHEPIAYITGSQGFWNHDFKVSKDTLIPRQDTETLVEVVLKQGAKSGRVLDIGTGTGCILISILDERPALTGVGLDISEGALAVARTNAHTCGTAERTELRSSTWLSALDATEVFEIIVSNPPYIPSEDIEILMQGVRDHEPALALDGGEDGLHAYRVILKEALPHLAEDGLLAVEVGILQANLVADMFKEAGLVSVTMHRDLMGVERVVSGKKSVNP